MILCPAPKSYKCYSGLSLTDWRQSEHLPTPRPSRGFHASLPLPESRFATKPKPGADMRLTTLQTSDPRSAHPNHSRGTAPFRRSLMATLLSSRPTDTLPRLDQLCHYPLMPSEFLLAKRPLILRTLVCPCTQSGNFQDPSIFDWF